MRKRTIAESITAAMATWTFIVAFLAFCLAEIWWNHTDFAKLHHWAFDPTTIILNLFLSLIAAVQGSIIMIAQNAQTKRDAAKEQKMEDMTQAILSLANKAHRHDEREEEIMRLQQDQLKAQSDAITRMADVLENTRRGVTQ